MRFIVLFYIILFNISLFSQTDLIDDVNNFTAWQGYLFSKENKKIAKKLKIDRDLTQITIKLDNDNLDVSDRLFYLIDDNNDTVWSSKTMPNGIVNLYTGKTKNDIFSATYSNYIFDSLNSDTINVVYSYKDSINSKIIDLYAIADTNSILNNKSFEKIVFGQMAMHKSADVNSKVDTIINTNYDIVDLLSRIKSTFLTSNEVWLSTALVFASDLKELDKTKVDELNDLIKYFSGEGVRFLFVYDSDINNEQEIIYRSISMFTGGRCIKYDKANSSSEKVEILVFNTINRLLKK